MKEEAVLHFVWYNKNTDSVKNGIVECLWTETLWLVECLTKFLGMCSFLNILLCLTGCSWVCLKSLQQDHVPEIE